MRTSKDFLKQFLNFTEFKVVAYYPYTSVVIMRFAEQNYNFKCDIEEELNAFFEKYMQEAEKLGAIRDNKVVIELSPISTFDKNNVNNLFYKSSNIFVGYKDNKVSIGLGVYQPDTFTQAHNLYLNRKTGKLELNKEI